MKLNDARLWFALALLFLFLTRPARSKDREETPPFGGFGGGDFGGGGAGGTF